MSKEDLVLKIANKIITTGLDCGSYYKLTTKPFYLSYRHVSVSGSYGSGIESKCEPYIVSLRCEKIDGVYFTKYISFAPYGSVSYSISTMTLRELKSLLNFIK